jgi:glucose dehydrogenase
LSVVAIYSSSGKFIAAGAQGGAVAAQDMATGDVAFHRQASTVADKLVREGAFEILVVMII